MKTHYTFRARWTRIISEFSAEIRLEIYGATMQYLIEGTITPGLSTAARMALAFIIDDITRSRRKNKKSGLVADKSEDSGNSGVSADTGNNKPENSITADDSIPSGNTDNAPATAQEAPEHSVAPDTHAATGGPAIAQPNVLNLLYGIINSKTPGG